MDDAYRMRDDPAIVAAFRDSQDSSISYLAWTTTPWTLPSNLALAINPEPWYCLVETEAWGKVILAEARLEAYSRQLKNVKVVNRLKGKDLVGNSYTPLFDFALDPDDRHRFTILAGDFVDAQSGTGIVHIAPAFGEEDFSLCMDMGIKIFNPVGPGGRFTDEAGFLAGKDVFDANFEIITHLKKSGQLSSLLEM